ncbi:hypothetical protein HAX54_050724 [Datura stramonium]|uniref:Wall-associated receptor kinase C-terminal domain-containing protein n=1 Tax=Datura stramonium TaxID=4076 RepID=A0ABS8SXG2_DATST|nr:hypothetical protein [Datura stramonium]
MDIASLICFLLLILVGAKGSSSNYSTCPKSFSCGDLTNMSFPFTLSTKPDCGIMPISDCDAKPYPRIQLLPGGDWYYALWKLYNYTVELRDIKLETTLRQHKCQAFNKNISLPDSPSISFKLLPVDILNFFKCNSTSSSTPKISQKKNDHFAGYKMYNGCKGFSIYYKLDGVDDEDVRADNLPASCSIVRLPIYPREYDDNFFNMLSPEFLVEWKLSDDCNECHYGGGQCRTDKTNNFHCYKDVSNLTTRTSKRGHLRTTRFMMATGAVLLTVGLLVLLFCFREKILWYKYISYGMMVLEMVGGRKNVDVGVDRTSEIYFPHWLYRRIELDKELQLVGIMNKEEKECARKMVMVSLWCIQTDPSNRPSMSKVVEMLEGNQDSLQIPPEPYLYSPSTTVVDSSEV